MVGILAPNPSGGEIYTCRTQIGCASLGQSGLNLPPPLRHLTTDDDPTLFVAVNQTVRRAQEGDADAFRMLYEEHGGRVYALCLRLSGDRAAAEELTQDVFVRVWEKLETFRGESAFSTWLHRLAVNEVLGEKRSASRRARRGALHRSARVAGATRH